ncbi:non-ribosomal peptide synthetase [Marinobacter nauticus]|uniref:non-ribosomal peptide synthetase n=1 Tax=Marinobacter nauticus TaxID=2743 RepID=UPI001CD31D24|nr:non-ribosomal peptide synthetase [Marinobacter nauticus]MCA0911883.1 amino acid adenylation domain-containing protein [Marinobacter nauticus]
MLEASASKNVDSSEITGWPLTALDVLFLDHAERDPDKLAVLSKEGALTYSELESKSRKWADWLVSGGLGCGDNILVCVDRTIELPAILLGILRAGACYVPVDPSLPADRIAIIVEDSGAKAAVTDRANIHLIPKVFSDQTFVVGAEPEGLKSQDLTSWEPEDLAYILFTSGSTGRPKGVPIPRGAMANFLLAMSKAPGIAPNDRVLALTTISFDISVLEIFLPLISGASVFLASRNEGLDPAILSSIIDENGLTLMQATPATWRMLIDYGWRPKSTHRLISGGEAFPVGLARTLCATAGEVWNGYGPTEATVYTSIHKLSAVDTDNAQIPLGDALPNLIYRITDDKGRQCRRGQPGELWVAGAQVTPGYYLRPELNRERFAEAEYDGQRYRFYRTGDLVCLNESGSLLYIDRLDNQVKIRGFRVELGEIETVLSSIPSLGESAVVLASPGGSEPSLVGCIRSDDPVDRIAIEAALAEKLPAYMVPKLWRWYPELPVTPSRKIDRKALKARIESESPEHQSQREVCFDNPGIEAMANRWQALLGTKPDSEESDFFLLGGHSLLAARLSVLIVKETGKRVRPIDLLTNSTLRQHAELLEQSTDTPAEEVHQPDASHLPERIPFSSAQKRMWYAVLASNSPGTFYESEAYSFDGNMDLERLQAAVNQVLGSHIAFRMVIAEGDDLQWRFIEPSENLNVVTLDGGDKAWESLPQLMREESTRPFDFYSEPLARFTLYTDNARRHVIQFVAHHMVIDGLSQTAVWKDIAINYEKAGSGRGAALAGSISPDPTFATYLIDPPRYDASDLDYWEGYLADAPGPLDLKTDFTRPPVQSFKGASVFQDLPKEFGNSLRRIARDLQATPFAVALALYGLFLDKHAQQRGYVVGVPVSGRQPPVSQETVGLFINTIPLRVNIDQTQSFDQLVRTVSRSSLDAMKHDMVPFDEVVKRVCGERDPSRMPVYQTMLGLNDYEERPSGLSSDLAWTPEVVDTGFSQFDVLLFVELYPDRMRLLLQGNLSLYARATLQRFLSRLAVMFEQVLDSPDILCEDVDCATENERAQLTSWQEEKRDYPRDSTVDECFRQKVKETPDHLAIKSGDKTLTYRQLDALAQGIADKLLKRGINAGDRVAISSRRTVETVTGILGILRAGASYVPLDLRYPDERLHAITALTEVGTVLANENDAAMLRERDVPLDIVPLQNSAKEGITAQSEIGGTTLGPDAPAYVMFTSGSTGLPKGIEVSNRNILRLVLNNNFMDLDDKTRFLMYAPVAFDASTLEIWGPLLNGGTLIVPEEEQLSVEELGDVLHREKVTALWLTAALFHHVAEHSPGIFSSVRNLLAGGDVLSPKWVKTVLEANPGLVLINGYGPTENTTFTCCFPMTSPDEVPSPIPVGYPIANSSVHILDAYGNDCPAGVPGNLYTGGDGVALGYVNDAERTDKVFVTDPYGRSIGRVYDTGDKACWREDGSVEFLGRSDNQVKIRGFRIEPDEVSTFLEQYPGIEQAITVPWLAPSGEKQLVSYVSPQLKSESERENINAWLREKLPRHMVPDHVVELDSFPVGNTGKVDRKRLPEPDIQKMVAKSGKKTSPLTSTERRLADIWCRVLKQNEISREDNFFHLGGTSINALQVFSSIVREMKRDIPLSTLLEHPTLAGLAAELDRQVPESGELTSRKTHIEERNWKSLVPMGGEGLRNPLVCVHAVGGNVLSYRGTLETIGKGRPRVGFQSRGLDGVGEPRPTLHEQASDYVDELLDAGYTGPFTLMGGSMGGTIALEMATILRKKGHEVDWVVLLDTIGPAGRSLESGQASEGSGLVRVSASALLSRLLEGGRSRVSFYFKTWAVALHRIIGKPVPYTLRPFFIEDRNKKALARHREQPYSGDVLLIRGTENFGGIYTDPKLGWEGFLAGRLEVRLADVAHDSFMESPVVIDVLKSFFADQSSRTSD